MRRLGEDGESKQMHTYHTVPWQMTLVPTGNKTDGMDIRYVCW